ncbi:MAG TPA: DNA replication/repair protein RecF [Candidatus Lumbricidophila sp.]|nr:DNA replication/repair protein RecF [Candidatus Lumbricidophila sp.]
MHLARLSLTNFRNYRSADLEFSPGITVVLGPNGQGKTNLVESVAYLATLGSHRVSSDAPLIRAGEDAAIVRARAQHEDRSVLLELQLNRSGANRAQINKAPAKTRDLPRYVHTVVFAPEDLAIVRGEPAVRRRLMDELLAQRSPRMLGVLADYDRALRQRNSLLKTAKVRGSDAALSTLDVWDERLVTFGAAIIDARDQLIADLAAPVTEAYRTIVDADHQPKISAVRSIDGVDPETDDPRGAGSPTAPVSVSGVGVVAAQGPAGVAPLHAEAPSVPSTIDRFLAALRAGRRAELERGLTLVGPHRDDLRIELNGLPAKGFASHGESWSLALALRLASIELLRRDATTGDPIVVLDDVFAELDRARRARLATAVATYEQVLITAAVAEDVPEELSARVIRIQSGEVVAGDA